MTLLQLKEVLGREGLSEIESVGKPFDPNYHEVVSTVPSEEHPENTVIREYMKGYLLNSRVLRTAKVEVSSGKIKQ
jgi:molecular chaperone GrpE